MLIFTILAALIVLYYIAFQLWKINSDLKFKENYKNWLQPNPKALKTRKTNKINKSNKLKYQN